MTKNQNRDSERDSCCGGVCGEGASRKGLIDKSVGFHLEFFRKLCEK